MSLSQSIGGKWKIVALATVVVLVSAIAVLVWYFMFYSNQDSTTTKSGSQFKKTEMKVSSVDKLTAQNSDFALGSFNTSSVSATNIMVITKFEKDESNNWVGGVYDTSVVYEGERSLSLISVNNKESLVYMNKKLDLSQMEFLEFTAYISDVTAFESMYLELGDASMSNYYRYTFFNLSNGWNLIQIPKEQFTRVGQNSAFNLNQIERVQFRTNSRPSSVLMARVDLMRTINRSEDFLKDWLVAAKGEKKFISLYKHNNQTTLLARNMGSYAGVLDKAKSVSDFVFSVKVSPQSIGRSGLFLRGNYSSGYGYYLYIYGDKDNRWEITKLGENGWGTEEDETKLTGNLGNDLFSKDKFYWLMAKAKGDKIEYFFSSDNQTYYKLGEITDSEFKSGGLGIVVFDGGWSLFDEMFMKKI